MDSKIREASHAGTWYNENPSQLDKELSGYLLKAAQDQKFKTVKAIIGPHAGFAYSGPTAAYAYQHLQSKEKLKIFLLGPCHFTYIKGIGLTKLEQYETPLGNLPINQEVITQIAKDLKKDFVFVEKAIEEEEHSLELHLPYIYKSFPNSTLIPIMIGQTPPEMEFNIGKVLAKYFDDPESIFIISTDFCHWGKRFQYAPYNKDLAEPIHKQIETLDKEAIKHIENHDSGAYYKYLNQTENTICGRHPVGVLLNIIKHSKLKLKTTLVKYAQSEQITQSNQSSVSYASLVTYVSE